ncbi:protein TolR [Bosea sp. (in: a-proteobacteria)]|jgi:biopolymer transport protein TolR|uniref:protein TolR n=1 Tax=Bosea sp. (in: a-proteobacteria) TaxID=1871050 RepID=UPI00086BAE37|nr:protein TolR [Bosea sp. (in: a-proteobacteria)]MBN9440131.1 protein TolR [Bosea sp. (in: a-proteobacteria)]MBN9447892.1 protein TolR [Bosea sp. (in: a-proteobacteria)]MBN9470843.1 protein TolR [Bosea sp. (in: a-proteobacteria)]ODT50061.1 MAG: protein TolR [Methylobacterium sp. SCN 67-24]
MGMSAAAGARAGGRRSRRRRHGAIAEINMTPFIDVMLVLLIIFMVAAPLIATGVPIDLPQTGAKPINVDQKPITIAIDDKGQIFLQDQPTLEPDLVQKLQAIAKQGFDDRIYVRGHKQVDYGRVASVMSTITSAGFKRVALVTEPSTH